MRERGMGMQGDEEQASEREERERGRGMSGKSYIK